MNGALPDPYYADDWVTLYCADCRELLPLLDLQAPAAIVTDPPYGIGANRMTLGNGQRRVDRGEGDWDSEPADLSLLLSLGLPSIIWGGNYFDLPPSRRWLVWDKGTGANDYADCELAWTNLDGVVKKFFRSWVGQNAREKDEHDRLHPTQKPISLMEWTIGFTTPGSVIVDPYAGSGSTLRAAKTLGRRTIGVEVEPRYCDLIATRCAQESLMWAPGVTIEVAPDAQLRFDDEGVAAT